jgi:branched-chain amino acid transport system substrate-binding protein
MHFNLRSRPQSIMFRTSGAVILLAFAGTILCSACSSNSNGTANASSDAPWAIGDISSITGQGSSQLADSNRTMQVWVDWTNAHGGINGHKLRLVAYDDGTNPTTSLADVERMVEQYHVLAIVGNESSVGDGWAAYVQKHDVPVIGGLLPTNVAITNADFFPAGTTQASKNDALLKVAKRVGGKKASFFYCAEVASCAEGAPIFASEAKSAGLQVGPAESVSDSAPSYTPQCLAAKSAGDNVVELFDAAAINLRIASNCLTQSFHPVEVAIGGVINANFDKQPAYQNAVIGEADFPFDETSSPALKTFVQAMNKYAPGVIGSSNYNEEVVQAWVAGQLFAAGAKAAHLGSNPTGTQLANGLESLKGTTLGGLTPPLTFAPGQGHQVLCTFVERIQNGKYTHPFGNRVFC